MVETASAWGQFGGTMVPSCAYWQGLPGGYRPVTLAMSLLLGGCSSAVEDTAQALGAGQDTFHLDPNCDVAEPIDAFLGQWLPETPFEAISVDDPPLAIFGPQGGRHFLLGLDVLNPAPGFPGARVSLSAHLCLDGCDGDQGWTQVASAQIDSVAGGTSWWPQDDGTVLLGSYFLILEYWSDTHDARIEADVFDTCGRLTHLQWTGQTGSDSVGTDSATTSQTQSL